MPRGLSPAQTSLVRLRTGPPPKENTLSSNVDPTDVLRATAEALNISPADVAKVAESLLSGITMPTVADFAPAVTEACSRKSLPTYKPHFRRLVEAHGDLRLVQVTPGHLEALRDQVIVKAGTDKINRAVANGRPLLSYELDAHGHGAGENCVRAMRYFFEHARKQRLTRDNPAMEVAVPKRPPAPERPLLPWELEEVAVVWCSTGNDPELDTLLFEFHRKTAGRREGALNLRLSNLDPQRGSVHLTEKFGKTREQPLDVDLLERLRRFAVSRGATRPSDHVFQSKRDTPITRKRYELIYDRLDEHTTWTRQLDLGVHWIRHTTLDDVRAVADSRVAAAFAGHSDSSGSTIDLYNKVTFEEVCAAYEAIFGPRFP